MDIPTTETMAASEARQHFSSLLNRVFKQGDRVVIEKSGIPVAVLVPMEDLRRLRRVDEEIAARKELVESFRKPFEGVPQDELEREIEKALAEVRAEMRAEREARIGC